MDNPRIEPGIRVGRFLLEDILRVLGLQISPYSSAHCYGMTEPLLAEMMACLHHVGGIELQSACGTTGAQLFYDQFGMLSGRQLPGLDRSLIRSALTRAEASMYVDYACRRADALNQDPDHRYTYCKLYLFGSCLTDKVNPGDVDLGVEVNYRDADEVPPPSGYPFGTMEPFTDAIRHLIPRGKRREVSCHDRREMQALGAPHRLIWTRESGRCDGLLTVPAPTEGTKKAYAEKRKRKQAKQDVADRFTERVRAVKEWPKPPTLHLEGVKDISRNEWLKLQEDDSVLAFAHLLCMPEGPLRQELDQDLAGLKLTNYRRERLNTLAAQYVKACLRFCPWSLRKNGRLMKRQGEKDR